MVEIKSIKFLLAKKLLMILLLLTTFSKTLTAQVVDYDSIDKVETDTSYVEKHVYDTSKYFFNWKEYYDDPYVAYPIKPNYKIDTAIQRYKKMDDFWYMAEIEKYKSNQVRLKMVYDSLLRVDSIKGTHKADGENVDDEQLLPSEVEQGSFIDLSIVRIILWSLIVGFFLFGIIYFLTTNKISIWQKKQDDSVVYENAEDNAVNIFQLPYQNLLDKALAEKNYRLYIRIQYLQTIKLFSEKGMIKFQPEFTNLNYLMQLKSSKYYNDFFTITRHYEYVWYGKFNVSENAFNSIKDEIVVLQNKLL